MTGNVNLCDVMLCCVVLCIFFMSCYVMLFLSIYIYICIYVYIDTCVCNISLSPFIGVKQPKYGRTKNPLKIELMHVRTSQYPAM